ncbi:hypothetical protein V8E53_003922 [Lactarius tabidus]
MSNVGAPEPDWMASIDIMYCHIHLWNEVPSRSTAVTVWLAHLVEVEEVIIWLLKFNKRSEEELDAWFVAHSIPRAEIRACISPYATPDWPSRFPRYAKMLEGDLLHYEMVVGTALQRHGGTCRQLPGPAQAAAFTEAGEIFAARAAVGMRPDCRLPTFSCRLAIERAEAFGPCIEYETYKPLPLEHPAYRTRAPLPERGDILPPPQLCMEDSKISTFNATLRECIARTTKRSPSPSSAGVDAPHATHGSHRSSPGGNPGGHRGSRAGSPAGSEPLPGHGH